MIVTVTPNPSVDRALDLQTLEVGEVNRALRSHTDAGGKGINISRVFALNGIRTCAVFPAGGPDGTLLISELLGWYLVFAHLLGGGLILVGLWTRVAALAQVPIMASAVFLLHWSQGFFVRGMTIDTPQGQRVIAAGYEFALLVLVATVSLILLGPGAVAVDGVRRRGRRA